LSLYTKIFSKTIELFCNYTIKTRIKKINYKLEYILINNINLYLYFTKSSSLLTTNFILNFLIIDKTIVKLLELIKNLNINLDLNWFFLILTILYAIYKLTIEFIFAFD